MTVGIAVSLKFGIPAGTYKRSYLRTVSSTLAIRLKLVNGLWPFGLVYPTTGRKVHLLSFYSQIWLWGSVATDILIAGSMIYLVRQREASKSTHFDIGFSS